MVFFRSLIKFIYKLLLFVIIPTVFINTDLLAQVSGSSNDSHPMHWARYWARGLFNKNLIYTTVWNVGNITDAGFSGGVGMRWPGSEGLNYLGNANFLIAAYVTDMAAYEGQVIPEQWDGTQFGIISNAYLPHVSNATVAQLSHDRTHQQILQPMPGWFNDGFYGYIWGINEDVNGDGELAPSEDVNYNGTLDLNLDPPEGILKSMAISTDKRTWPEYWPGGTYVGDTRPPAGRPPRTIEAGLRAGKWNGEYKAGPISDQETVYLMDDHENDYWEDYTAYRYWPLLNTDGTPNTTKWRDPDVNKLSVRGMGAEIESRTYAWFHPLAEDILVSVYRVRNFSDHNLDRVVTAYYADANIVEGNFNAVDYVVATYGAEDEGRLEFDILYQWHMFPDQLNVYQKVGVFGFGFLESPGIEYNGIDDDKDGMIDEDMANGFDDDGDWRPFDDIGLVDIPGTEGNGKWDTEDANANGALDTGEDINRNDKLDYEPVNDDRGTDGIGPDENGWPGPDPDGTETNGMIDIGEPNYDITDIDEADQAGLGHIYVWQPNKELRDQKTFWDKFLSKSEDPEIEETDENIAFVFGAKDVRLETVNALEQANRPVWKRFTIALLMGEDQEDIRRNKATMQSIYNDNYKFLTPPLQPTLVSNVSNKKVQLYWDTDAENSKDPFFGLDFNGYRIYKSSDPKFLDIKTITDAFGNVLLFEPLEIFDRSDDGLKGAHPIPFPNLGVHYDMGNNSGLKHSYVDTLVQNGRRYFYAVASIDAGNDYDFYDRGIVSEYYPLQAMPSECSFNITVNEIGDVVFRDRNTAVCIPQEPAAGYTEPYVDSLAIQHVSGYARGGIFNIDVFNKSHATEHLGDIFELTFEDDGWLTEKTNWYKWGSTSGITCINTTTGDTMFSLSYPGPSAFYGDAYNAMERGVFQGVKYEFNFPMEDQVDNDNDTQREIRVIKENAAGRETNEWKLWETDTKSNIRCNLIELTGSSSCIALPRDFDLVVYDHIVDTAYAPSANHLILKRYPLNFAVWDVTDPNNKIKMPVSVVYEKNTTKNNYLPPEMYGQVWDSTRISIRFPKINPNDAYWESWNLRFAKPDFARKDSIVIPPSPGDVFSFRTERNPTAEDVYRFTIDGGLWKAEDVKSTDEKKVYVVPDPYVAASSLEAIYELAGISQRRVDFVNLPPKCTIYIFSANGDLVRKLEHEEAFDVGRHSWDLTSTDGPEVAFGMYFFVVEAKGLKTQRGKFAIIK